MPRLVDGDLADRRLDVAAHLPEPTGRLSDGWTARAAEGRRSACQLRYRVAVEHLSVAAFADGPGTGNPAVVVFVRGGLEAAEMQRIASRFGAPATAFVHDTSGAAPAIRWFSPTTELSLCGHGTLAAAYAVTANRGSASVIFSSPAGPLRVDREGDWFVLDLPAEPAHPAAPPVRLVEGLGADPVSAGVTERGDILIEVDAPDTVAAIDPDLRLVAESAGHAVIVTAAGGVDCEVTSRVFAPAIGIDEDHATGSAHAAIGPWFFPRLGGQITARQHSPRRGLLRIEDRGQRVGVAGKVLER